MNQTFFDYYRCPEKFADFLSVGKPAEGAGFFRFGPEAVCYGRSSHGPLSGEPAGNLSDAFDAVTIGQSFAGLPFDLTEVVENLRREQYFRDQKPSLRRKWTERILRNSYYLVRPFLPVRVRRYAQRARLRGWDRIPFPRWPVDHAVDSLMETCMRLALQVNGVKEIPFVWFWPEGAPSCAVMTHDVETTAGRDFCSTLMNINDSYGIKSSFQVVPEKRYQVPPQYLESLRRRGFEINVQDLNHDGHLYREREEFLRRVEKINRYGRAYGAKGFRAGVLYRRIDWYDSFDFEYDMSVPSVAHLDPQRGGCCTVMPFFIGKILEIPVTTTQDYSLFHIFGEYSLELWEKQVSLIMSKYGLINFIVHPDYLLSRRAQATYRELLSYLDRLRSEGKIWLVLPGEVNTWWRNRSQMKLVPHKESWRIEGPGSERARLAFARLEEERIVYRVEPSSKAASA